jgi:hypothetical protein
MAKLKSKMSERRRTAGSLDAVVRRAITKYQAASRKYNSDCNQRLLKAPDAKRRMLAHKSNKAFNALMVTLKECTPNS